MVCHVIVTLDMINVDGVSKAGMLVQVARIAPQVRIIDESPQVAFEVTVVYGVEACQRRKQPNIRFGNRVPYQEALRGQAGFEPI